MATRIYVPLENDRGRVVVARSAGPRVMGTPGPDSPPPSRAVFAIYHEELGAELAALTARDLQGIRYALALILGGDQVEEYDGAELIPPTERAIEPAARDWRLE